MDGNSQLLVKTSRIDIKNLCPRFAICRTTRSCCFYSHFKRNLQPHNIFDWCRDKQFAMLRTFGNSVYQGFLSTHIANHKNHDYTRTNHIRTRHSDYISYCCIPTKITVKEMKCETRNRKQRWAAAKPAEGPRDASCQLKSCQLPCNSAETTYTTSPDQTDGMKLEI